MNLAPSTYRQPVRLFPTVKSYGITTLFGCPVDGNDPQMSAEGVTVNQWCHAAVTSGLTYWLPFHSLYDPSLFNHASCVGVIIQPEELNALGGDGKPIQSLAQCMATHDAIRKVTGKPIALVLDGSSLRYANVNGQTDADILGYGAACDVLVFDYYPVARGEGVDRIADIGSITARLKRLCPTKQVVVCIDTGNQHIELSAWLKGTPQGLKCRPPTLNEMLSEIRQATSNGADGIDWFSNDPYGNDGGWNDFDSTTTEIAAALPSINASLYPVAKPVTPAVQPGPSEIVIDGKRYTLTPKP